LNKGISLIAVECVAEKGVCERQRLVSFRFKSGEYVGKEVILTTPDEVTFNLGQNRIYKNRYIISHWADIIDFQTKKVLHIGKGEFIGIENERVIQHLNKVDVEGYFFYDLTSNKYARLNKPGKWRLQGLLSPDQTKTAEGGGYNIWLHSLDKKEHLLGSGFFVQADMSSSVTSKPPLYWLDNERILTQKNNGEIVLLKTDRTITPIVKIPVEDENFSQPLIYKDRDGNIVYRCCNQAFSIDVERKSYKPYEWIGLGNGFSAEEKRDKSYGHIIRFNGDEIGRLWGSVWSAPTTDGFIAIEYGKVGSNLGYPDGIKVWNSRNRKWTTFELDGLMEIIGWLEN
jgi:hypothetical protein